MSYTQPPMRGRMVDIGGGRSLRLVREGPETGTPTVLLEAGAFGFAADWGAVQQQLTEKGLRSCAYDRAGMGYSPPGPEPRDGAAIQADLDALLSAANITGPYVYVGHSMAGLRSRLFAARHPRELLGVVLVDAMGPHMSKHRGSTGFVKTFGMISDGAALAASIGLMKTVAPFGDMIGLPPEVSAEKRWAFGDIGHNRTAAAEVAMWETTSDQAAATPPFPKSMPVAVVMAGDPDNAWGKAKAWPAKISRYGHIEGVRDAGHANLLGEKHADAIVRGIEHVLAHAAPQTTKAAQTARP
ncbi:MAG: alpha/beta fold hydrolase [Caulobacteraceae bacterium]